MDDRVAIFDRISSHSFDAAVRMDDEFEAQLEGLTEFPELGRAGRIPGTRGLVIAGTSYVAAYKVEADIVDVYRILHGAQEWPEALQ